MMFLRLLREIKRRVKTMTVGSKIDPLIEVLISRGALLHNVNAYRQKYPHCRIAPVLKSNAYGHGLVLAAHLLDRERVAFFVVDSLYEANVLRENGIASPILVMGYASVAMMVSCVLRNVSFAVTSLEQLRALSEELSSPKTFHLKIDTGLHRQGIAPEQLDEAFDAMRRSRYFHLEGVCSHFADSDNEDDVFTRRQIAVWEASALRCKRAFRSIRFFHIANTAGSRFVGEITGNVVRIGRGLYGIDAAPKTARTLSLRLVLRIRSVVGSVKHIAAGEKVGYSGAYVATKNMTIATVPVGYFEGLDRRLSNKGFVGIRGIPCPIVGRISMNSVSVDVSGIPDLRLGDEAMVIGDDRDDRNSVEYMAELVGTIPHEMLAHIPQHLRRTVVE
jgi:alanine racemase